MGNIQKQRAWHILDVGSPWMREFASALHAIAPTTCWQPSMQTFGLFQDWQRSEKLENPELSVERFPLQRGYARRPLNTLAPFEHRLLKRVNARTADPLRTGLICSTPFYAPLAERWPGPVVYYSTDLTVAYPSVDAKQVRQLDIRMCRTATAVCPNSKRIANYFVSQAECDPEKITVVPNATRASNISAQPLLQPGPLPADLAGLKRPIAGVLGNLAGNMDWLLLEEAIELTSGITWVFAGPTTMSIPDQTQAAARSRVQEKAVFVGMKSYEQLQAYARAFDVAILPYRRHEPTYSGSSTRFYEHLAACRPILATRGFAELLEKPPLLTLVDEASEIAAQLRELAQQGFTDGLETARWEASHCGTWAERAKTLIHAVSKMRIWQRNVTCGKYCTRCIEDVLGLYSQSLTGDILR